MKDEGKMQYAYTIEYYYVIKNEIMPCSATQMDLRPSQLAPVVNNPPANTGDVGTVGSIPGSGGYLEEGMETNPSILAWRIP